MDNKVIKALNNEFFKDLFKAKPVYSYFANNDDVYVVHGGGTMCFKIKKEDFLFDLNNKLVVKETNQKRIEGILKAFSYDDLKHAIPDRIITDEEEKQEKFGMQCRGSKYEIQMFKNTDILHLNRKIIPAPILKVVTEYKLSEEGLHFRLYNDDNLIGLVMAFRTLKKG